MKDNKKPLNDEIRANKIQLISDDGENFGEMTLTEAREKASTEGLDLMEIGRNGELTIVKILDYEKYLYRQKKQEQKQKQKGKTPELKTLRITFKIGEHDLGVRRKQAEKFAEDGHPLKVSLMLRGRENHYANLAAEKMDHFVKSIEDIYKLDGPVRQMGNTFHAMLKPIK